MLPTRRLPSSVAISYWAGRCQNEFWIFLSSFDRAINTTPVHPVFKEPSLLKALTYYGLDGVSVGEKTYWRDVIMRGEPYTEEEQNGILDYCETDVVALARLLPVMVSRSHIDLPRALLRGRYMAAIARMQAVGVPIDRDRFDRLRERWEPIKEQLVTSLGSEYVVYDEKGSFSEKRLPGMFDGKAGDGHFTKMAGWI